MKDTIVIKDLEVFANHGVFPEEKKLGQKFVVSAELYTDFSKSVLNDDIALSVDYSAVCNEICAFMHDNTFNLIETAASRTAEFLLEKFPLLSGIKIEVKKPWAPIGLHVEYTSVILEKHWHNTYIALGSNMGDRYTYLNDAVEKLSKLKSCIVEKVSDFIITKPYGNVGQEDFLNGALLLKTYLDPFTLLDKLHEIENQANRKRTVHWGPRTLDLDIIFYDDIIINTETLTIPHIDMQNRRFVLEPLAQISPYVRNPVLNKTVSELLNDL